MFMEERETKLCEMSGSFFCDRAVNSQLKRKRAASPLSSCVSLKSNRSIRLPPDLSDGAVNSDSVVEHGGGFRTVSTLHKYACKLTLDPNTANNNLVLSEENRTVTRVRRKWSRSYPDHSDRFDEINPQVVCKESLTGRCYWEAQWSGSSAEIAVCYQGIKRKGGTDDCVFGRNDQSWSLFCTDQLFSVNHNNERTDISVNPDSSRTVGVFVDESSGSLSFYRVSDKLTQLHIINTTFTDTLHAGFRLGYKSSVSLCHI
ncbi:SPRY domain-containing protein isoform X1 [Danio rerio]|uniref:SPRY domain-containing protein isoform 1 n=3 Tax=Danio rerio TaxID=7955 RepID=A0A0R4IPW1_DANRE|nr:SPRY domain-containing protein isoform 1 [Danio rerio]|eukprot:XP_017210345.1 stonustoxin subunit beta-like [Danio rerio]